MIHPHPNPKSQHTTPTPTLSPRSVWYPTQRTTPTRTEALRAKRLVPVRLIPQVRPARLLSLTLLLALLLTLPGCNIFGAAGYLLAPRPKHEATYKLPDKSTLVLVEDATAMTGDPALSRNLAANIEKTLKDRDGVMQKSAFIPQEQIDTYLASLGERRSTARLSEIAAHFNARQLIYVKVHQYTMDVGGGVYRPQITNLVKVIDMDQRERVMPVNTDAKTGIQSSEEYVRVTTKTPTLNRTAQGASARSIASRELAAAAGEDIAKLFFTWREDEPGEKLESR